MKSTKREPGGELGVLLASDLVLAVNPHVTFRWSSRSGDADDRSRYISGVTDEAVGLSMLRSEERTLLSLADGHRSIDDLARLASMSTVVAVRHLRSLYDRGILVPADKLAALAPGERPSNWSSEMLAPAGITDALMSGPIEYDYAASPEADSELVAAARDNDASADEGPEGPAPGGDPVAAPEGDLPTPSPQMANATASPESTPAPASPSVDRLFQPKKTGSGPNVTLFWIPTPSEPSLFPSGVTGPSALPNESGDTPERSAVRKNTPEGTVVVMGSPAAPSSGIVEPRTAAPPPAAGSVSGPIPFRVGSYEVAARIAQGAMGSIYVCRRVGAAGFQRLFTLKVVRQYSNQKDIAVKSFAREARIGSLLGHPNVQAVVDVGTYEEQPFLILDYVEGTSLAELLGDDRRPPAPVAISIILDVLRGLQHVHEVLDEEGSRVGLLHGDVSPQNILIGVDGLARLTDFGSARFATEPLTAETDPVAVGKPAYMAPEQLRGDSTDARTDLFSVGVVMWTALTGQKLFAAETYDQTVMRVMRRKIPLPSELGSPLALDPIVLKALSRAPDGRYVTADEMAADIRKALGDESLIATPRVVGQWIRQEVGEALADRRRKIQEMFGNSGRTQGLGVRVQIPRPHRTTPKTPEGDRKRGEERTADGFERLPAPTIQIAAFVGRSGPSTVASPSASPLNRTRSNRVDKRFRRQWFVVILSAILAACALTVSIAYLVSSLTTPQKRAPRTHSGIGATNPGPSVTPPADDMSQKVLDSRELRPSGR